MTLVAKCRCGTGGLGDCPESCVYHPEYLTKAFNLSRDKNFPEDSWMENGSYICVCRFCNEQFVGYKRRIVCKQCLNK